MFYVLEFILLKSLMPMSFFHILKVFKHCSLEYFVNLISSSCLAPSWNSVDTNIRPFSRLLFYSQCSFLFTPNTSGAAFPFPLPGHPSDTTSWGSCCTMGGSAQLHFLGLPYILTLLSSKSLTFYKIGTRSHYVALAG